MSERKVLNKYYPPDFDPSKIPRLRLPRDRQYTVRLMAPCNMRCTTCGEYIYKGKKFNARKETVQNEEYLGIKIFRFYIKCPRCLAEITFKTDPENADYIVEHGASRNFQALKLAEEAAAKEARDLEEEEKNNPMKLLENRTQASKQEMELMETLAELKDLNQRHAKVDIKNLLEEKHQQLLNEVKMQEDEDEALIRSLFGKTEGKTIKRIIEDDEIESSVSTGVSQNPAKKQMVTSKSIGVLSKKTAENLVKLNKSTSATSDSVDCKQTALTVSPKSDELSVRQAQLPTVAYNKSIGIISKKNMANLVKLNKNSTVIPDPQQDKTPTVQKSSELSTRCNEPSTKQESVPSTSALSLLGAYSDSESGESS